MRILFTQVLISVLWLTSCNVYKEVKNEDLKTAFIPNSAPQFKGYYYEGSDSVYHYFVSKWDFVRDRYFKIKIDKLKVINGFKFNKGDKEIRIDLFKEDN